jgi:hypothetical protein
MKTPRDTGRERQSRRDATPHSPPGAPPALSRLVDVVSGLGSGVDVAVEAGEAERAALAKEFKIVGVDKLVGRFRVTPKGRTVHVGGEVSGDVRQTCVVTLEEFASRVVEKVDLDFAQDAPVGREQEGDETRSSELIDAPDPIINGKIDLGAITAEFLALGLDPYPRKPGVEGFAHIESEDPEESPFAALGRLKGDEKS